MAAWLVTEDPQQLIRVDTIAHVNPVAVFPDNDTTTAWEVSPARRFRAAHHVEIIVSTLAGEQVRALSCPGYVGWDAVAQLVYVLADLCGKYDAASQPVFVYGPRGKNARWTGQLWDVTQELPEPDTLPYW